MDDQKNDEETRKLNNELFEDTIGAESQGDNLMPEQAIDSGANLPILDIEMAEIQNGDTEGLKIDAQTVTAEERMGYAQIPISNPAGTQDDKKGLTPGFLFGNSTKTQDDAAEPESNSQDGGEVQIHGSLFGSLVDIQNASMEATEDGSPNDLPEPTNDFQDDDKAGTKTYSQVGESQNGMLESKDDSQDDIKAEIEVQTQGSFISNPTDIQDVNMEKMEINFHESSKAEYDSQRDALEYNSQLEEDAQVEDDSQFEEDAQLDEDSMDEPISENTLYEYSQFYVERCIEDSNDLITFSIESIINQQTDGKEEGMDLTPNDFEILRQGNPLNAKIIDSYLDLIKIRSLTEVLLPKVHAIPSFSYKGWNDDPQSVKRLIGHINLFEYDIVLFPIVDENHWLIVAVNLKKSIFTYYDSREFANTKEGQDCANKYVKPIKDFVEAEALDRLEVEDYCDNFKFCIQVEYSHHDEIDRGLLLCQFANDHCRPYGIAHFSQGSMIDLRMRVMIELTCSKLINF